MCFFINGSTLVSVRFFLVVLTILFCHSSEADGFGYNPVTTVVLMNELSPNTTLIYHCKSADDDLGERSLAFNTAWEWSFHNNLFLTTLYWCNFWWDDNGKRRQEGFQIYKAKRDFKRCVQFCRNDVRSDGIYGFNEGAEPYLLYKWP
ncbi:hypothetical protein MKX03_006156 [Papaver bracteatum]|nr:hypothetical protein MKX03_006156 [Papaver bracteatum]